MFTIASFMVLAGATGWVLAGVTTIIGVWNRADRERRKDADDVTNKLILGLQATLTAQERDMGVLKGRVDDQIKDIAHLTGVNKTLTDILQGRDLRTQELLTTMPTMLDILAEGKNIAAGNAEALTKLTSTIDTMIGKLDTLIDKMD